MSLSFKESDLGNINVIKTTLNEDKTKAFVCYLIENPKKAKCLYFNIIENKFYDVFLNETKCNTQYFGFNIFYFKETKEFIFSCNNNDKSTLYFKRVDKTFNVINDECIYEKKFTNCYEYSYFSVIYYSKIGQYSGIIQLKCNERRNIRAFKLSNEECMLPITTIPKYPIITTIPEIITN